MIEPAYWEPVMNRLPPGIRGGVSGQGLPFLEQLLTLNIQWMLEVEKIRRRQELGDQFGNQRKPVSNNIPSGYD